MNPFFDAYVAVDWSARSVPSSAKPRSDAIWVCEGNPTGATSESYWQTRSACRGHLLQRLHYHVSSGHRVLIGFDFAYGYPSGFAAALDLDRDVPPWLAIWREIARVIKDDSENHNNRFEVAALLNERFGGPEPGPLWGCPEAHRGPWLSAKSPRSRFPFPSRSGKEVANFRLVDMHLRSYGIQPIWKLIGSASVGSQSLLGIPMVAGLRCDPMISPNSRVWPYETGFAFDRIAELPRPLIVHAEIWPGLIFRRSDSPTLDDPIRDRAQVRAVVQYLASHDRGGTIDTLFEGPGDCSEASRRICEAEEGWILGAT